MKITNAHLFGFGCGLTFVSLLKILDKITLDISCLKGELFLMSIREREKAEEDEQA